MSNQRIIIKSTEKASKRTKNRIKENGSIFVRLNEANFHHSFNASAILVSAEKTNWIGWFPFNEISFDEVSTEG